MELLDPLVALRTPTAADADAVAAAVQAALSTIQPWMPWATDDYGPDEALQWINGTLEPGAVPFVIIDRTDGAVVGTVGLNHFDHLNRRANLGYWLRPEVTGRGLATRSARLVAAHGFDDLGLQRIEILMSVENEPSRQVAERLGAVHEGVLRRRLLLQGRHHDAHSYALLAEMPRSRPLDRSDRPDGP